MKSGYKAYKLLILIVFSISAALLSGSALLSYVQTPTEKKHFQLPSNTEQKKNIDKWLTALKSNNKRKALLLAEKITGGSYKKKLPEYQNLNLIQAANVNSISLTDEFGEIDFAFWKDNLEISQLAKEFADCPSPLKKLFKIMNSKINPDNRENPRTFANIIDIWKTGEGSYREKARLLCAIAEKLGYSAGVILIVKRTGEPIHLVCEFRKNDEIICIDPLYGIFLENISAAAATSYPDKYFQTWPFEFRKASKHKKVYCLPVEFAALRSANISLFENLKNATGATPLFRVNTPGLLKEFGRSVSRNGSDYFFSYWLYPLKTLKSSSNTPGSWKINLDSGKNIND